MQDLQVINDDVMGGRSRSKLLRTDTGLMFEGDLSLANGGGFASFRAPLRLAPDVAALQVADAELPPAVSRDRVDTLGRAGRAACYVGGSGPDGFMN